MFPRICAVCEFVSPFSEGFCPRCGARLDWDSGDDVFLHLQTIARMLRGGVWRHEWCVGHFKAQVAAVGKPFASEAFAAPVGRAFEWVVRELEQIVWDAELPALLKVMQICLELSKVGNGSAGPEVVGDWRNIRTHFDSGRRLFHALGELEKSVKEKPVTRRKLEGPLATVSAKTGFTGDFVASCIGKSLRHWPSIAVALELATPDAVQRENAVSQALRQLEGKNFGAAKTLFEKVLKADPRNVRALEGCGKVCARLGERTPALQYLERAVSAGASSPVTLNDFAWYLALEGRQERLPEAGQVALRAVDMLPTAGCFDTLAEIYERLQIPTMAMEAVRLGLQDNPEKESLRERMKRLSDEWTIRHPATGIQEPEPAACDGEISLLEGEDACDFELAYDDEDCEMSGSQVIVLFDDEDEALVESAFVPQPSARRDVEAILDGVEAALAHQTWGREEASGNASFAAAPVGAGGRGSTAGDGAGPPKDAVDCTAFAPPSVRTSDAFLVQVFAHVPQQADEARKFAIEFDSEATRRGVTSLGTRIARGSTLAFELVLKGVSIDEPVQSLVWQGATTSVQFAVEVPSDAQPRTLIGKVIVSQNSVPIGTIQFKLSIVAGGPAAEPESPKPIGEARRFRKAFVSYASHDRGEVLRRVQMLSAVGIEFFQDVLNLDAGQRWQDQLYRHIDESDVLFLFWSRAAKESEWVEREWRYGMDKMGDDFIQPVIIEGPPVIPPPRELAHLHFSDRILYFLHTPE